METTLIDGIFFWPVLMFLVCAVLCLIRWKDLQMSQRIFAAFLLVSIPFLVGTGFQAVNEREWLVYTFRITIVTHPCMTILWTFFLYIQYYSKRLPSWAWIFFLYPFVMGVLHLLVLFLPHNTPLWNIDAAAFRVLYHALLYVINPAILAFSFVKCFTYSRMSANFMADDESSQKAYLQQVLYILFFFALVQVPKYLDFIPELQTKRVILFIWAVVLSLFTVYFSRMVLENFDRPEIDGRQLEEIEQGKAVLMQLVEQDVISDVMQELEPFLEEDPSGTTVETEKNLLTETTEVHKASDTLHLQQPAQLDLKMQRLQLLDKFDRDHNFGQNLDDVMTKRKLYLRQKISISDVAHQLGTNQTYVSLYINEVMHLTFSEYINSLRIHREVLPRLQEDPNVSVSTLIFDCGFSTPSTFYRAFLTTIGESFQNYRKQLLEQNVTCV